MILWNLIKPFIMPSPPTIIISSSDRGNNTGAGNQLTIMVSGLNNSNAIFASNSNVSAGIVGSVASSGSSDDTSTQTSETSTQPPETSTT